MTIEDQKKPPHLLKFIAAMAASALVAGGGTAYVLGRDSARAKSNGPQPKTSIQELMMTQVDASADKIWGSAGSISDEHGFRELTPTTDAQWEDLRAATITLVEAPNLLVQEGRPVARPGVRIQDQGLEGTAPPDQIQKALAKDRPAFLQHAQRLQTVAGEILSAVDRRDAAALEQKGAELDEACEACHQRFWYPPKSK